MIGDASPWFLTFNKHLKWVVQYTYVHTYVKVHECQQLIARLCKILDVAI